MTETEIIQVTLIDATPVNKGRVIALASAELSISGVSFVMHGLQIVNCTDAVTHQPSVGVDLPRYRAPDGKWKQAITLPDELRGPLGDVVLEQCLAQGILKRK